MDSDFDDTDFIPARDNAVTVDLVVGDSGSAYIVCDNLFDKQLTRFEYDLRRASLHFVMEDGERRRFATPVSYEVGQHLQEQSLVTFVLIRQGEIEKHTDYPLVVHE